MTEALLVVNAGSSSIKLALFEVRGLAPRLRVKAQMARLGTAPHFTAKRADGRQIEDRDWSHEDMPDFESCLDFLRDWVVEHLEDATLVAIGHRVVHGGPKYAAPILVDDAVLQELKTYIPLAPLHQPHNLELIEFARSRDGDLPQVACFDTGFHAGHAKVEQAFALPRKYFEAGVRRYGFHGLSYEYIAGRLPRIAPELARGRTVVAHLGSGASMCALEAGHSVATTMGFTALDGLVMGTRCGAIDPGVLLYLQEVRGMSAQEIGDLLQHRSGLLGVSGVSSDMRDLLACDSEPCREAVELFVYRACREFGGLVACLGGIDGLVFTAGIGEHAPEVRARILKRLAWYGFALDEAANEAGGPRITREGSRLSAWVLPTDEELMIARHSMRLIAGGQAAGQDGRSAAG